MYVYECLHCVCVYVCVFLRICGACMWPFWEACAVKVDGMNIRTMDNISSNGYHASHIKLILLCSPFIMTCNWCEGLLKSRFHSNHITTYD